MATLANPLRRLPPHARWSLGTTVNLRATRFRGHVNRLELRCTAVQRHSSDNLTRGSPAGSIRDHSSSGLPDKSHLLL